MSDWMLARTQIKTRVLANSPVPSARINLSEFNSDPTDWVDPEPNFTTPSNSSWFRPQVDSVPVFDQPWIGDTAMMFRRGLLTFEWFFMAGTGEDDFASPINTLNTAFQRKAFGIVEMDDFDEPDVLGLTDGGKWMRVNSQAGFIVQQSSTESLIVDQFITVQSDPAAHGFAAEDAVGFNDSSGEWQKLTATTAGVANISQVGLVYFVPNANDFMIALPGSTVSLAGNAFGGGALYVDQSTAGAVTNTVPTAGVQWKIGSAIDSSRVSVIHTEPQTL